MPSRRKRQTRRQWRRVDLHLHTPASSDYQVTGVSNLDILRAAAARGLDLIAFTDHNSIAGYARMLAEIEELELLERLKRLHADERQRLDEYRRLRQKVLALPGFEFTATLGFHILGIFPETKSVREIEHILLDLNVPAEKLDQGSSEVGATVDVLTAYRVIDEAGGIAIAAHVNSSHGVAMRGLGFGGQTKIAYTQDPHLMALEVTDLEQKGKRATAAFFNGTKPEYPRHMHCIQGSDAHRLTSDPKTPKNLGVGERVTELLLDDVSFDALRELFQSTDFARSRPYRRSQAPVDFIRAAREAGPSIVQSFHDSYSRRGGRLKAIIADVCAFANTNGGTVYVGVPGDPRKRAAGVGDTKEAVRTIGQTIQSITPPLGASIDVHKSGNVNVVRVIVPRGADAPYAVDDNKIYLRVESETTLAVRDEIVQLVSRREEGERAAAVAEPAPLAGPVVNGAVASPRTGVEIVASDERDGRWYHTMRDLRNGNVVQNVTQKSARKLWHYAISQREKSTLDVGRLTWVGDLALVNRSAHAGKQRYDLAQRQPDGSIRIYYGVTEDGIHGPWRRLVGLED
ncbi:MAG TPA: RNA-binding domain-containing protein [Anaerolineae bacterium]|nr:RNA-binding domain-containing protein [Anaerolineae bacterium]